MSNKNANPKLAEAEIESMRTPGLAPPQKAHNQQLSATFVKVREHQTRHESPLHAHKLTTNEHFAPPNSSSSTMHLHTLTHLKRQTGGILCHK